MLVAIDLKALGAGVMLHVELCLFGALHMHQILAAATLGFDV